MYIAKTNYMQVREKKYQASQAAEFMFFVKLVNLPSSVSFQPPEKDEQENNSHP